MQRFSVSPLLPPRQHLSKTCLHLHLYAASGCSMPRLEELVPVSPCSCPPRGPQLFHSQVSFISQERACQGTFDFHSQVNTLSRSCLQVHLWLSLTSHFTSQERACKCTTDVHSWVTSLLSSSHSGRLATVARTSFVAQSSCSCELDTALRCHTSCCLGRPLWAWFCSWCSICSKTATRCHTSYWTGSHSTLSYLVCGASSYSTEPILGTRCHLIKINLLLFPLTVLRSLSFLIPSFTKINMSSNPVVHLRLTFAWGLLGVCHRDGSLAVFFPSLVGDSAEVVPSLLQKLKWLHHLSGLWYPLLWCKQIDNCHRTSIAWPHFPIHTEEIPLTWQTDNCCGICDTL